MDREEVQSRRAYNQIWNGAGRYDIRPEQAAFDTEGDADLYMNTVMGLAYGQYDFARFQPMLHSFQQQIKGGLYTDVFWLGLEHAVFTRAEKDRPALPVLRRAYAQRILSQPHPQDPRESAQGLQAVWARRILTGQDPEDARWITIPYCVGVALGVAVFYALPSARAITPMEVKLSAYRADMEKAEGREIHDGP